MSDEKPETKYTHEEVTNWESMRKATRKILEKIVKKPGENADILQVNFKTKEYIKITGQEQEFAEKGKLF